MSRRELFRKTVWGSLLASAAAALLLWVASVPPLLPSYANTVAGWKPSESWLYDRNGTLLDSLRVDFHARRLAWVKSDAIAPVVGQTIIAAEDKRFLDHDGIDWLAIGSAIRARFDGSVSRGASTISMQVAGFLAPELSQPGTRSWLDKLKQMRAAATLEDNWTKAQILEAYLNLAGFRGEAQGIAAASMSLFGKAPSALTREEAVMIAALLPSPSASADQIGKRACRIAADIPCETLRRTALSMTGRDRQSAFDPGLAPHLAIKLLTNPGMKIVTSLDANVQVLSTNALRQQLTGLGKERARDGAVVVLDNRSGEVLAYVGGVGGDSTAAAVDGADAPRQAGSTLKPFLFAQALEGGYITPASILDDSPIQLDTASGLYIPQNYDKGFKGPVSVRTALASSLNVPAVRALMLVGPEAFRDRLWDSGYRGITEDGQHYGFSLALGSAEVTLMEQAEAFRSLALGGRWSPARLKLDAPVEALRPVVSREAAWMVSDIMADPQARSTTFGLDSALKLPFWAAVKTGTSKAMRDNWCVGYTDRYTVAVWVGNLEGDSMQAVSGTSGAAPVWRDIMLALHKSDPGKAPAIPRGLEAHAISFSGNIESPRREYFLKGTGQPVQVIAPELSRRPRITNPVSGAIFALDPDIPLSRQQLGLAIRGSVETHRLLLNKRDIGPANSYPQIAMVRGSHLLTLVDAAGKQIDQVRFTIR